MHILLLLLLLLPSNTTLSEVSSVGTELNRDFGVSELTSNFIGLPHSRTNSINISWPLYGATHTQNTIHRFKQILFSSGFGTDVL